MLPRAMPIPFAAAMDTAEMLTMTHLCATLLPSRGPAAGTRIDVDVHGRMKSLGTHRLTRSTNVSHNATMTLDLALSGAKRVKSFVFYPAARVTP